MPEKFKLVLSLAQLSPSLLPSSAKGQAQLGLSWLYSQLIQVSMQSYAKFSASALVSYTEASWYLAQAGLSLAQLSPSLLNFFNFLNNLYFALS